MVVQRQRAPDRHLRHLRDLGNSVSSSSTTTRRSGAADHCVDMGPARACTGGRVIAPGHARRWRRTRRRSPTLPVGGARPSPMPARRKPFVPGEPACTSSTRAATTCAASASRFRSALHRHRRVRVGQESTLVNDTLYAAVARKFTAATPNRRRTTRSKAWTRWTRLVNVDQSPIGRTPRSNPATYTGLFTPIRELFAEVPAARTRLRAGTLFPSMSPAGAANRQATACSRSRCTSCPTSTCRATPATGGAITAKTLEVLYKAATSPRCSTHRRGRARAVRRRPVDRAQAADAADVGLIHPSGQSATTLSGGEGAARQARAGTLKARHRTHAVHPGRADDGPALRRHRPAAQGKTS